MKAFYHEMEPYFIRASGFDLRVLPMTDGAYRVFNQEKVIADLS